MINNNEKVFASPVFAQAAVVPESPAREVGFMSDKPKLVRSPKSGILMKIDVKAHSPRHGL